MPKRARKMWEHLTGSPYWYARTLDGGIHVRISHRGNGHYLVNSSEDRNLLMLGHGVLIRATSSLEDAKEHGREYINKLDA